MGTLNKVMPGQVTIINSDPNLGWYNDPPCTSPMGNLNLGTVARGDTVTKTIYVKNTGLRDFTDIAFSCDANPTTVGTLTAPNTGPLAKGASAGVDLTFASSPSATVGSPGYNLTAACSY